MARDITLLMQGEVAEARARRRIVHDAAQAQSSRPGPSCSPRHRGCPALVGDDALRWCRSTSAGLAGRGRRSGPQSRTACQATGSALAATSDVAAGLTVDAARMRANLDASRRGRVGGTRDDSDQSDLGSRSCAGPRRPVLTRANGAGQSFGDALTATPEMVAVLKEDEVRTFDRPEDISRPGRSASAALGGGDSAARVEPVARSPKPVVQSLKPAVCSSCGL